MDVQGGCTGRTDCTGAQHGCTGRTYWTDVHDGYIGRMYMRNVQGGGTKRICRTDVQDGTDVQEGRELNPIKSHAGCRKQNIGPHYHLAICFKMPDNNIMVITFVSNETLTLTLYSKTTY